MTHLKRQIRSLRLYENSFAQLAVFVPTTHGIMGLICSIKLGMAVMPVFSVAGSEVQGRPQLHNEFEDSLN